MKEYYETSIASAGTEIILSVWEAVEPIATVVFIPATMVHPLFYKHLLVALAKKRISCSWCASCWAW